jgi:hypothetical protein
VNVKSDFFTDIFCFFSALTSLTFCQFNQPMVVGLLPAGLTQLAFGDDFNQPVATGVLPAGLSLLKFGVGVSTSRWRQACCLLV